MKKILILLVVLYSTISTVHAGEIEVKQDLVNPGAEYLQGYEDGSIQLDRLITRAEIAQILYELEIYDNQTHTYKDVKEEDWFYDAFCIAPFSGYGDMTVKPYKGITGRELVSLLSRSLVVNFDVNELLKSTSCDIKITRGEAIDIISKFNESRVD